MKTILLALAVASAVPVSAAEGSAGRGCCLRPQEVPPRAPQKRALCYGVLWSLAQPGHCQAEPGQTHQCREAALTTLVMVREYSLTWNEKLKECVMISTGRAWPTAVAACDGNSC